MIRIRVRRAFATLVCACVFVGLGGSTAFAGPEARFTLAAKGVMVGDPDGAMRWGDTLSRAEAAKIVVTGMGFADGVEDVARTSTRFVDLTAGHWAFGYMKVAEEHGILQGNGEGSVEPDRPVTAAEFAVMLARAYRAVAGSGLSAVPYRVQPSWASGDLSLAPPVAEELGTAGSGSLSLDYPLSRLECGEVTYRVLRRLGRAYDLVGEVMRSDLLPGGIVVSVGSGSLDIEVASSAKVVDSSGEIGTSSLRLGDRVGLVLGDNRRCVLLVVEGRAGR